MTKTKATVSHKGKTFHILQPGERLMRDGSWRKADGTRGRGACVDARRAAAWRSSASKGKTTKTARKSSTAKKKRSS